MLVRSAASPSRCFLSTAPQSVSRELSLPWARDFNFLNLSFFICRMGIITPSSHGYQGVAVLLSLFFFLSILHLPMLCRIDHHAFFSSKQEDFQTFRAVHLNLALLHLPASHLGAWGEKA